MNFELTAAERSFRDETRAFFADLLTPEVLEQLRAGSRAETRRVMRAIGGRGLFGVTRPTGEGGRGLGPVEQFLAFDELMRAGGPMTTTFTLAPSIEDFGSEQQKQNILPRLLRGEITVCIGYSEPGAGTDLAALATRAVRDGDEYVINGQKTWTSVAQTADYVWLAARTDPSVPKHKGISVFLVPMDTLGIKVLPIDIIGDADINRVFYEDVRIPVSARVGAENEGWRIITGALNYERVVLCSSAVLERAVDETIEWARTHRRSDGRRVIDDGWVQRTLARLVARVEVLRLLNLRNAWSTEIGDLDAAQASATKVYGAELYQEVFEGLMGVVGEYAYLRDGEPGELHHRLEHAYRVHVILTFAGGTSEIQRDLIATFGLGMPRAPR